ncbi:hypothetical protein PRK78_002513 [Emydomyces testavorans]|uniref:Uncharacterized protein n=1 Tax=Emydomyces testavorans TaxID=2070801 RepID=A0AAF0DEG2_9EURO|nr:hypothetical protein PRK78_002513 [Emydomyces testavorans]
MSLQTMTQIPLSHDDHNRIRCPTFNPKSTSSFTAPSNPNEYLNFYQTYRYPTHTESQTSSSFSHDAQSHHDDPRTSQLSNGPSSLSSSTMASASNAKVTQIRSFDPSQPTVPAAALILASSPEPTSISDNRGFSWHEQREWEQTKNDMALGTLVAEPVSQRRRTLDSVVDTEEDDDEEEEDDEAVDTSDHENAFYILIKSITVEDVPIEPLCNHTFFY